MKGITPVIATILLLLITISMVGFAFVWFTGMFGSIATSTENATQQQLIQMNQNINIESAKTGAITVRNIGSYGIPNASLSVYINGVLQTNCKFFGPSVLPNAVITTTGTCTCVVNDVIKVTAPGNFDVDSCVV